MRFEDFLLALIARAPSSGYDLGRWLATEGQFIRANADQSRIYKALNGLVKAGLVEFCVEPREGAPDAKVYKVTTEGASYLLELTESPYLPPRWQEADFTARYFCLVPLNPPSVIPLIETELAFRREQVRLYRHRDRSLHFAQDHILMDIEVVRELLDDIHNYDAQTTDAWIAWFEGTHQKWTERLASPDRAQGQLAGAPGLSQR